MSQRKSQSAIITDDPKLRRMHRNFADDIHRDGRTIVCVPGEDGPSFAYTIGNALLKLPELLMIGSLEGAYVLNGLSQKMIDRGKPFDEREVADVGWRQSVMIITADKRAHNDYTIQAGQYHGHEDYQVQQVLISDREGRFPDDPECQPPYSTVPVLGHRRH